MKKAEIQNYLLKRFCLMLLLTVWLVPYSTAGLLLLAIASFKRVSSNMAIAVTLLSLILSGIALNFGSSFFAYLFGWEYVQYTLYAAPITFFTSILVALRTYAWQRKIWHKLSPD
ncbi:MAG TPA: hypothetical protein VK154_18145 [Chitinophagales bacterium]|nr:hypothetical protein [Chitinophagales bacterium]